MHARCRGQRVRFGCVVFSASLAAVWLTLASLAPALMAQDTAQIRIKLTVPQRIHARIDTASAYSGGRRICIASDDSVPFSVASLISRGGAWQLVPLVPAATDSPGICAAGVTLSIAAGTGGPVTLVLSPE